MANFDLAGFLQAMMGNRKVMQQGMNLPYQRANQMGIQSNRRPVMNMGIIGMGSNGQTTQAGTGPKNPLKGMTTANSKRNSMSNYATAFMNTLNGIGIQ